jgi:YVTN family beta-propeller protein
MNAKEWVLFAAALSLFVVGCDESCAFDPDFQYTTCLVSGVSTLAKMDGLGHKYPYEGGSDLKCDTPGSDSQPKSQHAVNPQSSAKSGSSAGRAANGATAAYLPRRILNLPFFPMVPEGQSLDSACDPATSPDVLQVDHVNGVVIRFGNCAGAVRATIRVATRPLQIEVTPDGQTALVTSFDNVINFIDLNTNSVSFALRTNLYNPSGIAVSPDGTTAYVTSYSTNNPAVLVVDLPSRSVTATIPIASYPHSAFMTPDGSQVYVTFPDSDGVYIIDTASNTVASTIAIAAPYSVAFNSTGTLAFITSARGSPNTVKVVDTATFQVVKSYPVGLGPVDIEMVIRRPPPGGYELRRVFHFRN